MLLIALDKFKRLLRLGLKRRSHLCDCLHFMTAPLRAHAHLVQGFHPDDFKAGGGGVHPDMMQPGPGRGSDFDSMFG